MNELLQKLADDLAELASRGVNHPAGDQIIGGMRVTIQQAADMAGTPPPPADPIAEQLRKLGEQIDRLEFALLAAVEGTKP